MQREADVLHGVGVEKEWRALDLSTRAGSEQVQMRFHQIAQPGALPVLANHEVLRFSQALDALRQLLDKLTNSRALARSLQRHPLHDSQLVFGPMGELSHEECRLVLSTLKLQGRGAERLDHSVRFNEW